jgi:hypothetical protein
MSWSGGSVGGGEGGGGGVQQVLMSFLIDYIGGGGGRGCVCSLNDIFRLGARVSVGGGGERSVDS